MASAFVNKRSNPSAATLTTLYTVPASTQGLISTLTICNRSATPTSFRIAVRPLGASIDDSHYLYYDVAIAGNDTFSFTIGAALIATDVVSVYATLATLTFTAFIQEFT